MPPLKIYASREFLPAGAPHTVLLYPFWGEARSDRKSPTGRRFDKYIDVARSFFAVVDDLRDADIALLPFAWEHVDVFPDARDAADRLAAEARGAGKQLLVFYVSDEDDRVPQEAVVYRTSLYRSRLRRGEYAMPALTSDVLAEYTNREPAPRGYRERPVVSFCGYAPGLPTDWSARAWVRAARERARVAVGRAHGDTLVRARALRRLRRSKSIETDFVLRSAFMGGAVVAGAPPDHDALRRVRTEFVENLMFSDYVFCARGGGNYSYRLYETLSAGRIPVFVDTDCVLPFENEIDWRSLCVWIDRGEIDSIAERVADFHQSFGAQEFDAHQERCRDVWERHLSPQGFFETLSRQLRESHVPRGA